MTRINRVSGIRYSRVLRELEELRNHVAAPTLASIMKVLADKLKGITSADAATVSEELFDRVDIGLDRLEELMAAPPPETSAPADSGIQEPSMEIEKIAEACHEANRGLCLAFGDESQPRWADAPEWQRKSAIAGVEFHRDNPNATPSASHDSWLEEKRRDGWKYGPTKDPEKKEHPCFVPYDALPVEQRVKDYAFKAICTALLGH